MVTRAITLVEFERFAETDDDRRFELIHGEVVEKLPTEEHGVVVARLVARLLLHVEAHDLGRVAVEARHRIPDDDHNSRIPDLVFTCKERLLPLTKKGSVPQMPDLAVEVQSPGQSEKRMADKADYYLQNGARMVWLLYPQKGIVEVLTADDRKLLVETDMLDGGDVLPGFALDVAYLFKDI